MFRAADLCCGLGGWTEGLQAEGYEVRGYDIERHEYGDERYPGDLIIRNVLEMHGSELADVDLIVASPPCQKYSYMAMPFSRGRTQAAEIRADKTGQSLVALNAIFDACFRLQREAQEAAGWPIPMVVENVRGARPWVGPAVAHYGSYYLWGDVPLPLPDGRPTKVQGFRFDGSGGSFQTAAVKEGRKHHGDWFRDPTCLSHQGGQAKLRWFNDGPRSPDSMASMSSNSPARKAASARIAKIPLELARHVGRAYRW